MPKQEPQPASGPVDLIAMAEKAETAYRELVAMLAAGETVDEASIREIASAAGRPLPTVATHVDRLRQRLQAAEDLACLDALQAEIDAAKLAIGDAETAFEHAKAKAELIVIEARNALEEAQQARARLVDDKTRRERNALETLRSTADPAIETGKRSILKGAGFQRLQASRSERPSAALVQKQARREVEAIDANAAELRGLQLDALAGMSWE